MSAQGMITRIAMGYKTSKQLQGLGFDRNPKRTIYKEF
jgi:hypothetical protein